MGEWLGTVQKSGAAWNVSSAARESRRLESTAGSPHPEQEQLARYAEAFLGLARMFQEMPCQKERLGDEDLECIFRELKEQECDSCTGEDVCWGSQYFEFCSLLYEMMSDLERRGSVSRQLAAQLREVCIRPEEVM